MQDDNSELILLVTGNSKDGRRRYDARSKRTLAKAYLQLCESLTDIALQHSVNANLLRKLVASYHLAIATGMPNIAMADRADFRGTGYYRKFSN
jgi:hypothetical protein